MKLARVTVIWAALAVAVAVPIAAAAASPLLAWRDPLYIAAGFAGVIALALMLVQPLLMSGYLPGLSAHRGRRTHRWIGGVLVAAVVVHVGGLWITSPPDIIDALLFTSPTPFSAWGVIAMWAIFAVALLALLRRRLGLRRWRIVHMSLAVVIVAGSVAVNARGARVGKGGGYSDLEFALARAAGAVDARTTVLTTVHALQVVTDDIPMTPHDVPVDLVVTPDRVIRTRPSFRKPPGIRWHELSAEQLAAMPAVRRLRRTAGRARRRP